MSDDMMRLVEPLIPAPRRYAAGPAARTRDRRWHQHRADGNARTWVFTILHNLAVNRLKQTARRSYCL